MLTSNVTLALPKRLLQRAKAMAAKERKSLSSLMVEALTHRIEAEERYQEARIRHQALLEAGAKLGTQGKSTWTREDLHGR
jgi:predicted transcriptional regulator